MKSLMKTKNFQMIRRRRDCNTTLGHIRAVGSFFYIGGEGGGTGGGAKIPVTIVS